MARSARSRGAQATVEGLANSDAFSSSEASSSAPAVSDTRPQNSPVGSAESQQNSHDDTENQSKSTVDNVLQQRKALESASSELAAAAPLSAAEKARAAALAVASKLARLNVTMPMPMIPKTKPRADSGSNSGGSSSSNHSAIRPDGTLDTRAPVVKAALKAIASTRFGVGGMALDGGAEDNDGSNDSNAADAGSGSSAMGRRQSKAAKRGLTAAGRTTHSEGAGLRGSAGLIHYASSDGTMPAAASSSSSSSAAASSSSVRSALSRSSLINGSMPLDATSASAPLVHQGFMAAHRERVKEIDSTAGRGWFNMPAAEMTPELRRELLILRSRAYLDPKRHYKTHRDEATGGLPKFVQLGTVQEGAAEFYSSRLTNKERKGSLVDQLLADEQVRKYAKKNYDAVTAAANAGNRASFKKGRVDKLPAWKRAGGDKGGWKKPQAKRVRK